MRVIKLILLSGIVFFGLLFAISLLIPSHVRISRAIDLQTNRSAIMPLISTEAGWTKWNAYAKMADGKAGFRIESVSDSLVLGKWTHGGRTISNGLALYEIKSGTLTVQLYMDFFLDWYPWDKFGSILYDSQLGPAMEESLRELKALAAAHSS